MVKLVIITVWYSLATDFCEQDEDAGLWSECVAGGRKWVISSGSQNVAIQNNTHTTRHGVIHVPILVCKYFLSYTIIQ